MPQLSRVSTINSDLKQTKRSVSNVTVSPAIDGQTQFNISRNYSGVLTLSSFGAWNITPNNTFTANVLIWGGGGSSAPANGGAGGFSTATMVFRENVSYNVVVGRAGSSGSGGGGSGIEFLSNSIVIIVAGGGGAGGSGIGGAGGGLIAQNAPSGGSGGSAYSASSPGSLRVGGPSASTFGFGAGGAGPAGGGGGGIYGGAASAGGGGGGGGWIESTELLAANTQTGTNTTPPFSTYSGRGTNGNGAPSGGLSGSDGLVVITVL